MNWKKQYQKALTFSYDDGNVQDKKLLDILNRYGMKCTFNVNTGLDFDHGTWGVPGCAGSASAEPGGMPGTLCRS